MSAPPVSAGAALVMTARFAATHAVLFGESETAAPWLVTSAVLMAQQAAALALKAAGDHVPEKAGATELMLRAGGRNRLPPPYTLSFSGAARIKFDRLVEARNRFMHPRAEAWHVSDETLSDGLPVATGAVRHLTLVQPVVPDLVAPDLMDELEDALAEIEALAEFLNA